jgi:hypothetical protein
MEGVAMQLTDHFGILPVSGRPNAARPVHHAPSPAQRGEASTAIAVLSWAWAAISVDPGPRLPTQQDAWTPGRWSAAHPSDAGLVAHLAGQLS